MRKHTAELLIPFGEPQKEHVFWHDFKRFFTINNFQLENLSTGVYGKLPKALIEPIQDLQRTNTIALLTIENLRVAQKIQSGVMKEAKLEQIELNSFLKSCNSLISSYTDSLKIKIIGSKTTLNSDKSLLKIIIWNILVFISIALYDKSTVEIGVSKNNCMTLKTKILDKNFDLKKLLSIEDIFSPREEDYLKYSSLIVTPKLIVDEFGKEFVIEKKNSQLQIDITF
jgi:hypothetical protein